MLTLVLLCLLAPCQGFNLDTSHADIIADPTGDPISYFGYAISFWNQTSNGTSKIWLLVGAPRGEVPNLKGERVRRPGTVYKCPVPSRNTSSCTMIPLLGKDETKEQDLRWRYKAKDIPYRAWIGSTLAVEDKPNGSVVVCGPRFKRWVNVDLRYIPGTCFSWEDDQKVTNLPSIMSVYPNKESGFETGFAQGGMSADFLKDPSKSQLIIGSPGADFFKGAISVLEKVKGKPGLPNLRKPAAPQVSYDSYMGYSVASARFHKEGTISYIAGAPRAKGSDFYTGSVYVVQQPHAARWLAVMTLKGQQMGEYFGASLAVLDLHADNLDDVLLVGAPLHSLPPTSEAASEGDHGVVYMYLNKGSGRLELDEMKLSGSSAPGARFGTSLAVVGDINKDGFTDLAVGAPYEGTGVVYLYHGHSAGLKSRYSQRIAASDIHLSLRGFGISIASGMDIDGNSFKDIAVGSHEAGKAVVIKSFPVIDFDAGLHLEVKRLNMNADRFSVKACLQYHTTAAEGLLLNIDAETNLIVDPVLKRAELKDPKDTLYKNNVSCQIRLQRNVTSCWDLEVVLKDNLLQVTRPIELTFEYKVLDDISSNKEREFCKLCPMTDPTRPSSVHVKLPFAHGCHSKNACMADLKVHVESSNNGRPVVVGRDSRLVLTVTVNNSGDPAYLSRLSVALPNQAMLVKVPTVCSQEELLLCTLANPLTTQISIMLEVDLRGIELSTKELEFHFNVWSASEELTPEDNSFIINVPVELDSHVVIHGTSYHSNILITSRDPTPSSLIPVIHKYEVVNFGPSPVAAAVVEINIPAGVDRADKKEIFLDFPEPQMTIDGHIFRCSMDQSTLNDSSVMDLASVPWLEPEDVRHRQRRSVEAKVEQQWPEQRSLTAKVEQTRRYLNCSGGEGVCVSVTCVAGPLSPLVRAEVTIQLLFRRLVLGRILNPEEAIVFETVGTIKIMDEDKYRSSLDDSHNVASAETVFVGEVSRDSVASWVLPLSTALGLLMFLLLVKAMSNLGFFKRGFKDKLEDMREKAAAERNFHVIPGYYDDSRY